MAALLAGLPINFLTKINQLRITSTQQAFAVTLVTVATAGASRFGQTERSVTQ